jgi:eukaryotic-like serine/threonine-protein kinase
MMDIERWREVERLYHSALGQATGQRAAFLEQACGADESLLREVCSLLEKSEQASTFLESPAIEIAAQSLAESTPATGHSLPAVIGRYRIIRLLGEGGMGTVYEAEQEEPRRFVALKVIKLGSATPDRLRRFRRESQALARLQHPGIAQIYDAGIAETGIGPQPYFAMELIRGLPLRQYAEVHRLTTRQSLMLMVKVCEGVHHAHQRGLIHRDLKPGNILVDGTGQPKILDFGVARVTEPDSQGGAALEIDAQPTMQTGIGQIVGTLAYMSPEQVLGDPLEVDTRTDIYSLGVILYELLSERLPYDVKQRPFPEAVRAIREDEPASLSSISRGYRGDIETIAGKALEKDKARRYASAADLSTDIQHYLNDEPIAARPPSAGYQLQKFARRYRALVGGAAAVFVVLVVGIWASTWEAIRANQASEAALAQRDRAAAAERVATEQRDRAAAAERVAAEQRDRALQSQRAARAAEAVAVTERNRAVVERQRAEEQSATANAISDFLQKDVLSQASATVQAGPAKKPDPDLKVRTALDRAAARIEGKFANQPLVEASIRQTIGRAYRDLGLFPEAQQHLERALELRRRVLGEDHKETLDVMNNVAQVYESEGNYAQAETLFSKSLGVSRRVAGNQDPQTLTLMDDLGALYSHERKYPQAEPLLAQALETRRRLLGESNPDTLIVMNNLGLLYTQEGKYAQAEPLFVKTLALRRRVSGDEHPNTLTVMNNLALVYDNEGKYVDAEPLLNQVLEIRRRVLGEEHANTLNVMHNLAALYRKEGKYSEAEALFVKTLDIRRRVAGRDHPDTLSAMNNLAMVYRMESKYIEAEALFRDVRDARSRALGNNDSATLNTATMLGLVQFQEQRYQDADYTLRTALNGYQTARIETWERFHCQSLLGAALLMEKRFAEAEPLLLSGYDGMFQVRSAMPVEYRPFLADVRGAIIRLYEDWGKAAKASEWRNSRKEAFPGQ